MKTYNITLIIFLAIFAITACLALLSAESNETDSSDAISLYNDTSNISEGLVISPAPLNEETNLNGNYSNWKYFWKNFQTNFMRNQTLKIERQLELANLKLIQAKMLLEKGNIKASEKALEQHDKLLDYVQERIEKMENKSLTPGLDNAIAVHEMRLERLITLLNNSNLTEQNREVFERRINHLENITSHLENVRGKMEQRRENVISRLQNKSDKSEDREDKIRNRIENRTNNSNDVNQNNNNQRDDNDSENNEVEDD